MTIDTDELDSLRSYFRDIGEIDVMSAEDERRAAERIAAARTAVWREALGWRPLCGPVARLMLQIDGEHRPTDAICQVETAAKRGEKERLAACNAAATAFAAADVEGVVLRQVLADVAAASGGSLPGWLQVSPRPKALAFRRYLERMQLALEAWNREKQAFAAANLRLVVTIARRHRRPRMEIGDLIQEGNIGLLKAIDRFDHRRGFRFSTYGSWWIRHAVQRACVNKGRTIRIPVHIAEAHNKLQRIAQEFMQLHGRAASDAELSELSGLAPKRIAHVRARWIDVDSLDAPLRMGGESSLAETIADEADAVDEQVAEEEKLAQLRGALDALPKIEAEILRLRAGFAEDELTLREVGERFGLSRERIRQIQEIALARLRGRLEPRPHRRPVRDPVTAW